MSAAAMPVARNAGGHLLPGARLNPSGLAKSPVSGLQRRFWKRLEQLAKEHRSIESLCEQVILALEDQDYDPRLRAEILPRILGPVVVQLELAGADGSAAQERSPEDRARLAEEFGAEVAGCALVHSPEAIDVTPTRVT